jgi:hypothetical protein
MARRERIQVSDRSEEIEAKDAIIDERTGPHSAEDALQEVCAEPGHSAGADHKERVLEYPAVAKHQPISEQDDECQNEKMARLAKIRDTRRECGSQIVGQIMQIERKWLVQQEYDEDTRGNNIRRSNTS